MDFALIYVQLYELLFPVYQKCIWPSSYTWELIYSNKLQFNSLYVPHHCSMIKEKGQETACGQNKIPVFYRVDYWKIPNQINTMMKDIT